MEYRFEYMFPRQLEQRMADMPVVFAPTGLLEWHADHLPLGQDALKAHGICIRAAEKLGGGVVMPPNYFGTPGFSSYLGTLTYTEDCLRPVFLAYLEQLAKIGAKVIMLITGHYGSIQVDFIRDVADRFRAQYPNVTLFARPEYEDIEVDGETPADHAGKWETSMFMSIYPDAVDMDSYQTKPDGMKTYKNPPADYFREPPEWDFGYDVRAASSIELGKKAIEIITDKMVADIRGAL